MFLGSKKFFVFFWGCLKHLSNPIGKRIGGCGAENREGQGKRKEGKIKMLGDQVVVVAAVVVQSVLIQTEAKLEVVGLFPTFLSFFRFVVDCCLCVSVCERGRE